MVFDSWNQYLFTLLQQVLLNCPDMLDVADILIEFRIYSHVFGPDSKAFSVLVLILDVKNEWNASGILRHHFFEEAHCQMDTLDNQRFVPLIKGIDHFCKLFRDQRTLLLVTF